MSNVERLRGLGLPVDNRDPVDDVTMRRGSLVVVIPNNAPTHIHGLTDRVIDAAHIVLGFERMQLGVGGAPAPQLAERGVREGVCACRLDGSASGDVVGNSNTGGKVDV